MNTEEAMLRQAGGVGTQDELALNPCVAAENPEGHHSFRGPI